MKLSGSGTGRSPSSSGLSEKSRLSDASLPELDPGKLDETIRGTMALRFEEWKVKGNTPIVPLPENPAELPPMPVRRLQNYAYCPRQFYYQWVENIFVENTDTMEGTNAHRITDQPSRLGDAENLDLPEGRSLRSLQIENIELGLVGKIDVIEGGTVGIEVLDYKKGGARRDENNVRVPKEYDAVQIAAYALLLEHEGYTVSRG